MKRLGLFLTLSILLTVSAYGAPRTFVSAQHGLDTNSCSVTAPCRTFGAALGVTDPGGEVIALDSGGYGPVVISQSVSLTAPAGVYAGITTTSPAIAVNILNGAVVNLRGLTLNGLNGTGTWGIADYAGELHLENVVIAGFNVGMSVYVGKVYIVNSIVRNNNLHGLYAYGSDGANPVLVAVERSSFLKNSDGVQADGFSQIAIRDSVSNLNSVGFQAGVLAGTSVINMQNCEAALNDTGIIVYNGGAATINVAGSHISANNVGLTSSAPSAINSAGDNVLRYNNTADGTFDGTFAKR